MRIVFDAAVTEPENCASACSPASRFAFPFDAYELDALEYESGRLLLSGATAFETASLGALDAVRFLALSIEAGQEGDVQLLLGAPPELQGAAGVFPLLAPGTLAFSLLTFTSGGASTARVVVSVSLLAGDTAALAITRINAAALLAGAADLIALLVGGQIRLRGDVPGALETLQVVTPLAAAGFPSAVAPRGTGSPVTIDRVFAASFGASPVLPGEDVWLAGGPAMLRYFAAGS